MLNIIHINTNDIRGGAAKVPLRLVKWQKKEGLSSLFLVGKKESLSDLTFPLNTFCFENEQLEYKRLGYLDYEYKSAFQVINNPLIQKADIIHLHNLHGGFFHIKALENLARQKPIIWTLHDMQSLTGHCAHSMSCQKWQKGCRECPDLNSYPPINKDATSILWNDKKDVFSRSRFHIVCPSLWLKSKVSRSYLSQQPIDVIYNGVDTKQFHTIQNRELLKRKFNLERDNIIIGCVVNGGVLKDKWKGGIFIDKIINALKLSGINFTFLNIGSLNTEQHDLIRNIGYITDEDELRDIYNLFDIFLYPSLADNCPLVLLEAMACGVPIVTFETGGIPEIVRHCQEGYIAKYGDIDSLIKYTLDLVRNQLIRNRFSTSARLRTTSFFDQDIIAKKYVDTYGQTIENFKNKHSNDAVSETMQPSQIKCSIIKHEHTMPRIGIFLSSQTGDTHLSLCNQDYPNIDIFINQFDISLLKKLNLDLIWKVNEGYRFQNNYLRTILYEYNLEDIIASAIRIEKKDESLFYGYHLPTWRKDNNKYLMMNYNLSNLIIRKDFYIDNYKQFESGKCIQVNKILQYKTDLAKVSVEILVHDLLSKVRNCNIFIYGAGTHTLDLLNNTDLSQYNLCGILDKNPNLAGSKLDKYPIFSVSEMDKLDIDYILISSFSYESEIYHELREKGFKNLIRLYG